MSHSKLKYLLLSLVVPLSLFANKLSAQEEEEAPVAQEQGYLYDPAAVEDFERGQKLAAEEKYDEALAAYNEALKIQRDYIEAYIAKGLVLNELEEWDAAKDVFRLAIDFGAESAVAYNGRGEALLELGTWDMAYKDFTEALNLDRTNAKVLANLGHVEINYQQDPVAALRYLDDSIALDPNYARAYRDRGLAHARLQETDEAKADLKKAAEVDPGDYENFSTLASIYLYEEDYAEAVDALTHAIESYKPKKRTDLEMYAEGYLLRADARLKLGDAEVETDEAASTAAYEASIADTQIVLDKYPERFPYAGQALYRRALAERMLGKYSEAIKSFTEAIRNVPPGQQAGYLADAYMRRGICWHYQDYDDLARGDFEQAASTNFGDPKPDFWKGLTYANEGDYRQAIKAYSVALGKYPGYPLAYVNRGLAYFQLEDYDRAIENFNDAIRTEPAEPEHYYKRGIAHMKLEEYKKAVNSFRSALLYKPDMTKAQTMMAKAQRAIGNDELAEQYEIEAGE